MAWVKVTNVSDALIPPIIKIEPSTPNGNNKWYKRTEEDRETKLKVTIETNSPTADRIMYTTAGAHNEKRDETNPVMGKTATFEITETGKTSIIAKIGSQDGYESKESQKEIKLDNIKPEITELKLEPKPDGGNPLTILWNKSPVEVKVTAEDKRRRTEQ